MIAIIVESAQGRRGVLGYFLFYVISILNRVYTIGHFILSLVNGVETRVCSRNRQVSYRLRLSYLVINSFHTLSVATFGWLSLLILVEGAILKGCSFVMIHQS